CLAALIAQALERNPDLYLEAARRHTTLRFVDVIGIQIDDAVEATARISPAGRSGDSFTAHTVLLRPERVYRKEQGAAAVEEGVEQDLDVVIGADDNIQILLDTFLDRRRCCRGPRVSPARRCRA